MSFVVEAIGSSASAFVPYSRWPVLPATRIAPRTPSAGGAGAPGTALAETTWAVEAAVPGATLAAPARAAGATATAVASVTAAAARICTRRRPLTDAA